MKTQSEEGEISVSMQLEELIHSDTPEDLDEYVKSLSISETAHALPSLSSEDQQAIISLLDSEDAARLVEAIPEFQAAEIIAHLEPEEAAEIISVVESDEQADILAKIPSEQAEEILSNMDESIALNARERLEYPEHSAAGLMVTEFLCFDEHLTVNSIIDVLREKMNSLSDHAIQYVFIQSENKKLKGVLRLRDLVLVPHDTPVSQIMIPDPISVTAEAELQELVDTFDDHRFLGVPVLDDSEKIIGVVRRADVQEAVGDRNESDYLKSSGIISEELRTMPFLPRSRRRLSWLSINIVLNIMAASVIALYQETLEAVIVLAVFLPIISDMSGCSGAQAIAVSIRELTLGILKPSDLFRVLRKEVQMGIVNGLVLGGLTALVVWLWKGNPYLGLVIGSALTINTIVAVTIGGMLPVLLKKFGKDPALASGPILTTLTDMCGFFVVLSLAQATLPLLV